MSLFVYGAGVKFQTNYLRGGDCRRGLFPPNEFCIAAAASAAGGVAGRAFHGARSEIWKTKPPSGN
jgi:hypothetical protein